MKFSTTYKLTCIFGLLLLMTGCTITREVHITYNSDGSSPLETIKPCKISLVVQDDCPEDEKGQLAHINKVILVADKNVEVILADALKTELIKSGHEIIANSESVADAMVKVNLKRMRYALQQRGAFQLVKTVLMQADVTVARIGQENRASHFEVKEVNEKTYTLVASGASEEIVNQTFHDFVRDMILDPRFIEPLL